MEQVKMYFMYLKTNRTSLVFIFLIIIVLHTIHFLIVKPNFHVEKTLYLKNGSSSVSSGLAGLIGMGALGGSSVNVDEVNQYMLSYEVYSQFRKRCEKNNKIDQKQFFDISNAYESIYLGSIETRPDKLTNSIRISVSNNDSIYVALLSEFIRESIVRHFKTEEEENEFIILSKMDSKVDSLKAVLDVDIVKYARLQDRSREIFLNSNKVEESILLKNIELNKVLLENYLRLTETTRAELKSNTFRIKEVLQTPQFGIRKEKSILLYGISSCMLSFFYSFIDWARRYFL